MDDSDSTKRETDPSLKAAFDEFKVQLNDLVLPPQGVNFACLSHEKFVLPQLIQLRCLLSLLTERRLHKAV